MITKNTVFITFVVKEYPGGAIFLFTTSVVSMHGMQVISMVELCVQYQMLMYVIYNIRVGTENRTSLDNPVILAVESFKVTSYKFCFSDETMFILPSNDFLFQTAFTDKQIIATSLN